MIDLDALDFAKGNGLVTIVVQDAATGEVLMLAHADREALLRTIDTGDVHFRSRTRGLWHKGESSGNTMRVVSLTADCDGDAVLAQVSPAGPACHTGSKTCFRDAAPQSAFAQLDEVVASRARDLDHPGYTRRLLNDRNLRLKKLGEEAIELAVACADCDARRVVSEAADLAYHMVVALRAVGATWADLEREMRARAAASDRWG
jgi:phosphoribosyl-ATP pyrophosphohydrolase/phosphoribosyl-AMP cyclohydrolase